MLFWVYGCNSKSRENPDVRLNNILQQNENFVKNKNVIAVQVAEVIDCRKI